MHVLFILSILLVAFLLSSWLQYRSTEHVLYVFLLYVFLVFENML